MGGGRKSGMRGGEVYEVWMMVMVGTCGDR